MRGSISIDQAFMMSVDDREICGAIIKDNIDMVKKTKMPLL